MAKKVALTDLLEKEDSEKLIEQLSFEDGISVLEELVTKVESGSLALDSAMHSYEKGVRLIERLKTLLSGAEEKLKVLQKPAGKS